MLQRSFFSNFSSWLQSFSLKRLSWLNTRCGKYRSFFFLHILQKKESVVLVASSTRFWFCERPTRLGFYYLLPGICSAVQYCQIIPTIVDNSRAFGSLMPYGYAHFNWVGETLVRGKVSSSGQQCLSCFLFNKIPTYSNGWMIPSVTWTFVFGVVQIINWMTVTWLLNSSWRVVTTGLDESNS